MRLLHLNKLVTTDRENLALEKEVACSRRARWPLRKKVLKGFAHVKGRGAAYCREKRKEASGEKKVRERFPRA